MEKFDESIKKLKCVLTYVYSLLIEKDLHEFWNMSVRFPRSLLFYLCLLGKSFPFLFQFLYFCKNNMAQLE